MAMPYHTNPIPAYYTIPHRTTLHRTVRRQPPVSFVDRTLFSYILIVSFLSHPLTHSLDSFHSLVEKQGGSEHLLKHSSRGMIVDKVIRAIH